jgi:hypothetical protein
MDYMHLGRTGLKVSRLALGTMNFGELTDEATSLSPKKSSAAGWRRTVGASGSCWRPKYISPWKRGRRNNRIAHDGLLNLSCAFDACFVSILLRASSKSFFDSIDQKLSFLVLRRGAK